VGDNFSFSLDYYEDDLERLDRREALGEPYKETRKQWSGRVSTCTARHL
jgi:hypothetical protein